MDAWKNGQKILKLTAVPNVTAVSLKKNDSFLNINERDKNDGYGSI
jgi:molybdopterin-guanine dinucleotide biosynthesis protein A